MKNIQYQSTIQPYQFSSKASITQKYSKDIVQNSHSTTNTSKIQEILNLDNHDYSKYTNSFKNQTILPNRKRKIDVTSCSTFKIKTQMSVSKQNLTKNHKSQSNQTHKIRCITTQIHQKNLNFLKETDFYLKKILQKKVNGKKCAELLLNPEISKKKIQQKIYNIEENKQNLKENSSNFRRDRKLNHIKQKNLAIQDFKQTLQIKKQQFLNWIVLNRDNLTARIKPQKVETPINKLLEQEEKSTKKIFRYFKNN